MMQPMTRPGWLAGKRYEPNHDLSVTDKYSSEVVATVPLADDEAIDRAIAAAVTAQAPLRETPAWKRRDALLHCVHSFEARAEELAVTLCEEAGKPIRDARGEVTRLIDTFRCAAEEATRIRGEYLPLDSTPRGNGTIGLCRRVPIGPCSFISPFNFPLNLAAHKVAPAIAAGCPFVLKPASATPLGALIIGETLAECDLPEGTFSILPCTREGASRFVSDERFKLLSFTGSAEVGWDLKARAGHKKVVLELGGNAAVIVERDASDDAASLERLVERLVFGAYYQSGQSCISVQRILIHSSLYQQLRHLLLAAVQDLVSGDPKDERTRIGPMISEREAARLEGSVDQACRHGARILCGGTRKGTMFEPTLLEDVPRDVALYGEEAFGPVAMLEAFESFEEALSRANESRYGLQAGVFTRDVNKIRRAWDVLEVGGVVIGDVPSWRADDMPYGGVKDSGLGREGVRYAIEEMTEPRLLVLRHA
jgi:acyl-CoA reductase-like NAD-dependent aldehyde dehydrogenase